MRLLGSRDALQSLGEVLASIPVPPGHSDSLQTYELSPNLHKRVGSGANCGPAAGNAVCGSGLCCSGAGICGTGGAFCDAPDCQLSFGPACDGNQTPTGSDTSKVPRPTFGNVPYGVSISHCTVTGKVALTFDDGPYIYTTELLDLLKRNNVRATFFVVGNNAGKGHINDASSGYVPIIQRMIADGHQVGSHSWSHQDLDAATPAHRRAQILNNEIALNSILGVIPTYFRPPYTKCGEACSSDLKALGYHILNYDIDTRDWQNGGAAAESTYKAILTQHSPASSQWISLAHDVQPHTVHTLAQFMIDTARALGYDLVTVGDCLGDPPANWYRNTTSGQASAAHAKAASQSSSSAGGGAALSSGQGSTQAATAATAATAAGATPTTGGTGTGTGEGGAGLDGSTASRAVSSAAATEQAGGGSPKPNSGSAWNGIGALAGGMACGWLLWSMIVA